MRLLKTYGISLLFLGLLGLAGRLLPHPPNFTPMEAMALYSGAWAPRWYHGAGSLLAIMAVSDLVLGWHALWPFTWGSLLIGIFLGRYSFPMHRLTGALAAALIQATLFFLVTNWGVWLGGWYGYSVSGLVTCYLAAIPFFHYQLLGAGFYTTLVWLIVYKALPKLNVRWSLERRSV